MKNLTDFEVYKLLDSLNLLEASCLIIGASPNEIRDAADDSNNEYDFHERFYLNSGTDTAKYFPLVLNSLLRSIELNKIEASKITYYSTRVNSYSTDNTVNDMKIVDPKRTYIEKEILIGWLKQRGVYPEALFPLEPDNEILNESHPFYSGKLALIVEAWQQLKYAELDNQTVKNYLESWIKENSPKFGFDTMGDTTISSLAEIVNFEKGGRRVSGSLIDAFDSQEKQYTRLIKKQTNKHKNKADICNEISESDLPF